MRLLLEAGCHKESCFVTLTYKPESLPPGGTLERRALSGFIKRVRSRFGVAGALRYYGVGEYGDRTQRPHYHVILFGISARWARLLQECWQFGMVDVRVLSRELAQYICHYTVKKMTGKGDRRLNGRLPEYSRQSTRPGIGALAVGAIVDALTSRSGVEAVVIEGDVPFHLKRGKDKWPLDRYIRGKVRDALGYEKVDFRSTATGLRQASQMQLLRHDVQVAAGKKVNRLMREDLVAGRLSQLGSRSQAAWEAKNRNLSSKRRI